MDKSEALREGDKKEGESMVCPCLRRTDQDLSSLDSRQTEGRPDETDLHLILLSFLH